MAFLHSTRRAATARPWLTALVVLVIAGGTAAGVLLAGGDSSASGVTSPTGATTRLVDVTTATVSQSVATTGDFAPVIDKQVSFSSGATVTSVRVTAGQRVSKGQVLGTIDALSLKAGLAQARSSLASARATLSDAEDSDATSSAQVAADKATVQTAQQSVTAARDALTDATLRAPVAGVVAAVNVSKGDQTSGSSSTGTSGTTGASSATTATGDDTSTASAGGSSGSGDFEIIGTSSWKVSVDVDDTEIGKIAVGQQAQLTTDNHTGTIFGTVTARSVLSSSSSGSATYPVTVTVTGSPSGLHDGAEATVRIIYKQATNVVTVPSAAVHSDGKTSYVYLSDDGSKVKKTVTTGITSGTSTQITSGLTAGEQVYEQVAVPGAGSSNGTGRFGRRSGSLPSGAPQGGFGGAGGFGGGGGFPGGAAGGGS